MPSGTGHNQWTHPTRPKDSYKAKQTLTPIRLSIRENTWLPIKRALQVHLESAPKGEANKIAHFCSIHPSQIHKYSCPICEHDAEPCYSIGEMIRLYLKNYKPTNQFKHHTVFQSIKRKSIKLVEVIRQSDGSYDTIQLN